MTDCGRRVMLAEATVAEHPKKKAPATSGGGGMGSTDLLISLDIEHGAVASRPRSQPRADVVNAYWDRDMDVALGDSGTAPPVAVR